MSISRDCCANTTISGLRSRANARCRQGGVALKAEFAGVLKDGLAVSEKVLVDLDSGSGNLPQQMLGSGCAVR
jgi:hypothetical protein